jgi:ankyrin repeat protein
MRPDVTSDAILPSAKASKVTVTGGSGKPGGETRVSLIEERKRSFSGGNSSNVASNICSSPSSHSDRASRAPSSGSLGGIGVIAGSDTENKCLNNSCEAGISQPPSLADRAEPQKAVPAASSNGTPGLVNIHNGLLALDQLDEEFSLRPERLNERDSNGRTPLLASCFSKNWSLAKYFVDKGADVSAKDRFGATALIFSAMCNELEICKLLITRGADLYLKNNIGRNALSFVTNAESKEALTAAASACGNGEVCNATSEGIVERVGTKSRPTSARMQSLQRTFSSKNSADNAGVDYESPKSSSTPVDKALSDMALKPTSVFSPNKVITSSSLPGAGSPAIPTVDKAPVVSLHGNNAAALEAIAKELEEHPGRLNERDSNGRTPLLAACFAKKWDLAKFLVYNGADVTAKDKVSPWISHGCVAR